MLGMARRVMREARKTPSWQIDEPCQMSAKGRMVLPQLNGRLLKIRQTAARSLLD
jgi:hypothetical protein